MPDSALKSQRGNKTGSFKTGSSEILHGAGQRLKALYKGFVREDKVLIIITADPDSLASAVAFKRLMWRRVAQITVASTNRVRRPDNLHLVAALKLKLPLLAELNLADYTKLVILDSQPHHCVQTENLHFQAVIDHHPLGPAGGGPEFFEVRPDYGATATIFVNYLRAAKIKPNLVLATALFYAIKTDTQNFVRQGQLEDMAAFRWLYPLINQSLLSAIERAPIDRTSFKVMLEALGQAVFHKNFAYTFVEKLDHADTLVLIADFLMLINGVSRAVTSGVDKDKLVVVLRSAGLRSHIGHLAKTAFGAYGSAGGHKNMARAEMELSDLDPKIVSKPGQISRFVHRRLTESLSRKKPLEHKSSEEKSQEPKPDKTP
ncbi:MAG: DHH family phosphoesterase [Deltaproteobacteria bacterium]|jgi:nanoRNase/pAp phosphatase (c-di-AMP/oligoRNAs hydrolase)|nr:DHH family phosphoesterase [Deltaproteobacteria bacterium]